MEDCDPLGCRLREGGGVGQLWQPPASPAPDHNNEDDNEDKKCNKKSITFNGRTKTSKTTSRTIQQRISSVILLKMILFQLIAMISLLTTTHCHALHQQQPQQQQHPSPLQVPNEYKLVGHAGGLARLPCLIGKQAHCGEPYFIAWYKLNATSRQWMRLEARAPSSSSDQGPDQEEELARPAVAQLGGGPALGAATANRPLADRVQFVWSRDQSPLSSSCFLGSEPNSPNQTMPGALLPLAHHHHSTTTTIAQPPGLSLLSAFQLFDCAQLTIRPLELQDEAQYKCEITFSESVEFDRCPASTTTQLNVIARPNEPEILLNGRPAASHQAGNGLTFKEGAQVRLECQSAGGKPAPRIEWLNLTTWTAGATGGLGYTSGAHFAFAPAAATTKNETQQQGNSMKLNDDQSMDNSARWQLEGNMNSNSNLNNDNDDDNDDQLQLQQPRAPRPEQVVQLMRLHWPIKRATYSVNSYDSIAASQQQLNNNINQNGQQQLQLIPVTSSSITITLSRFDLRSRFACLVLPMTTATATTTPLVVTQPASSNSINGQGSSNNNNNQAQSDSNNNELQLLAELPASLRNARALNQAANQVPMLANSRLHSPDGPMLKWIQLSVLAKPTSVSIRVLELQTGAPTDQFQANRPTAAGAGGAAAVQLVRPHQQAGSKQQPFYSLRPNRLYAIQCLVENSRPPSQVAWFNRTAPLELSEPTIELDTADYLMPASRLSHKLTSFVRHIEQEWGTFRTVSTLLLTTNFHDNFQELFCRVSNEAFQFDELVQVAPIISARIYVNYPPTAWLEAPDADWTPSPTNHNRPGAGQASPNLEPTATTNNKLGRLSGELGQRVQLRCLVGANPMLQNMIVQIDWLKDGRRLSTSNASTSANGSTTKPMAQQQQQQRIQIEKANHLHMPLASQQQQQQQQQQQLDQLAVARLTAGSGDPSLLESSGLAAATSARLLTASSLTISALAKTDAGLYSCQFKLIPAPSSVGLQQVVASGGQANISMPLFQQQQQARIISGQSGQAIQLTVIEAKLPIVRVSSANGLFVYDRIGAQQTGARTTGNSQQSSGSHNSLPQHQRLEVVVAEPSAELSLKCEHPSQAARATITTANYPELGPARRVLWYLNGAFVHSSANSDLLVLKPPMSADGESANDAASLMRLKLVSGNGGRLSCAHQILDSMAPGGGSTQTLPGSAFHAQSMKLSPSANEVDLRFKVAPMLLPADERRELLMPRYRSFSELELIAQPLNKLKLVCLAQCEPVCSIEWLVNKRPLNNKLELMDSSPMMAGGSNELLDQQLAQVQEIADNQTRIFKSARRLEPSSSGGAIHQSLLMESPLPRAPPAPIQLIQVDNLIHRKTASNLEHFPWYKQTSFVPVPTSVSSSSEMATQVELASRQLMRDSYELANGLAAAAAGAAATAASPSGTSSGVRGPESSFVSNVFSKLELSYNQMSRLLAETNSRWSESEGASQAPGAVMQRPSPVGLRTNEAPQQQQQQQQLMDTSSELLVECKLDEAFGGRQSQFGYAHVKPGEFYPYLRQKNDDHHHHQQAWTSGVDESAALAGDEQQSDLARTVLNTDQIELRSVLSSSLPAMGSAGWAVGQHEPSTTRTTTTTNRFETRILLERSSQQQPPMMTGTGQSTPVAPSLAELGQQQASKGTTGGGGGPNGHHLYQHQANSNNYPAILAATSNTSSSSSQQTEAQLVKFSSGPHQQLNQQQQQTPAGSSLTPSVRNWLVGHQERILVGASVLALVWLLALFVSPLVQRYLTRSSPKFGFSRAAAAATRHQHHHRENKKTTNWRFNKQHTLSSRTSSTNEIGVTGGAGGGAGSSSSSSSMMAHKFGLQEPPVTFGFGLSSAAAAAAANYYGPPESNGAESSEHDMVQSCSQSSNYEEFTQLHHHQMQQQQQHHTQQRLLHQQPLYFNQAQLIESTTLSRRPLVPSSSSLTASETSAAAAALAGRQRHHHQQQQRQKQPTQQQHYPATMRHNLASVPLISGLNNSGTSSRINFSDLQRHSRAGELGLSRQTTSNGNGSGGGGSVGPGLQLQRHHYSFGKIPLQPAPSGQINGTVQQQQQQRPNNNIEHQEHIYDDVS